MSTELAEIYTYFPAADTVHTKNDLVEEAIHEIRNDDRLSICGYPDVQSLREGLLRTTGRGSVDTYQSPDHTTLSKMRTVIQDEIERSHAVYPFPTKMYVFVFPYIPAEFEQDMHGIMGFTPYSCVFHIFVDPNTFSYAALRDVVPHELNHTLFFYERYQRFMNQELVLFDDILMEGLAEHFKDDVTQSPRSKWTKAVSEEHAFNILNKLYSTGVLYQNNEVLHKDLMFGGENYDQWTGYSIGYWLVHRAREQYPNLSWPELMNQEFEFYRPFIT